MKTTEQIQALITLKKQRIVDTKKLSLLEKSTVRQIIRVLQDEIELLTWVLGE